MSAEFKVTLVMAVSANGKITDGEDPDVGKWTSEEDKAHFVQVRKNAKLIIVGRKTFEAVRAKPSKDRLRIVLTSNPEKYKEYEVKGQLEFTNENPRDLVERLKKDGYSEMLLLGGADVNGSFLKDGLITDAVLTIEPVFFGEGRPIFSEGDTEASLELISVERLNEKGTLLAKYKVLHNILRTS